ncbi:MAG: hypothetical protein IKV25_06610 [Clostridia bacterium]|nr:hypothetical protein [Clostridia bacterium]
MIENFTKRAYLTLFNLLNLRFNNTCDKELRRLLGDMCPYTFKDSNSADPATYEDFLDCLNDCYSETKKMDITTTFKASIKFLEVYRDEFGFAIQKVIDDISLKEYETIFAETNKREF